MNSPKELDVACIIHGRNFDPNEWIYCFVTRIGSWRVEQQPLDNHFETPGKAFATWGIAVVHPCFGMFSGIANSCCVNASSIIT